jgi:hypothetical protein
MLTIIWILLNLALLVWIAVIFVRAIKLVNKEYGRTSAFVFTMGLIALFSYGKETNRVLHAKNSTKLNHLSEYYIEEIDLNPLQTLSISIAVDAVEDRYECKTNENGYMLPAALKWEEISTSVLPVKNGYTYNIYGSKEWRILSFPIYKQIVCLTGKVVKK